MSVLPSKNLLIQTKRSSDTASESETSDDGSKDDHDHEDLGTVPEGDRESEELAAPRLSGPPEDGVAAGFLYVAETEPAGPAPAGLYVADTEPAGPPPAGFLYVAETEPAGPAPALIDPESMRTEGDASARVSNPDPLFFDSEPTRTGRRRKCRDMSGLSQCLCGDTAKPDEEGSIQCQKLGCETVWVGPRFYDWLAISFELLANSVNSITLSASGTRMHVHETGPVMHVH